MDEPSQPPVPTPSQSARQWAMLCHFAAALGFVFPFGNLIGPLIVWQIKREQDAFIDEQGKEALNFQITVAIAAIVSILLMLVLIGFLLLSLVAIGAIVLSIIAGIKAGEGRSYRYPFCLRLVK
ncbi:DUF4870 domain-containing protein [Phytopseudomonas dryadis]|uniref:DUF4870 domain-containing protein n=1 Tax=Phytopseudomonas dryadis TaxID=2487520 RepID=A0A4V6MX91_9GAMM|nr:MULTISPECIES: DUF4870 domain-containing protein [Pseudomonas]TBU92609.1 DUF4870 domain-containing protein [Pseudomonas dryadis]TBU99652.1 DUF4870 domain-containing protein [Pseudomonas dryadis]TBV17744.1 DUF4870 domain-containing protein [Pseudomonas sp. FRB 230]